MATTIKIIVKRSDPWLREMRIDLGDNVPSEIMVPVDPVALSRASREHILLQSCNGIYEDLSGIRYESGGCSRPEIPIEIDALEPTVPQIDNAIWAAARAAAAKTEEYQQRMAEKEASELAAKQAEEAKQAKIKDARELLSSELAALRSQLESAENSADSLAELVEAIDNDAVRAAAEKLEIADVEKLHNSIVLLPDDE